MPGARVAQAKSRAGSYPTNTGRQPKHGVNGVLAVPVIETLVWICTDIELLTFRYEIQ